jgi:hypothetical protein
VAKYMGGMRVRLLCGWTEARSRLLDGWIGSVGAYHDIAPVSMLRLPLQSILPASLQG